MSFVVSTLHVKLGDAMERTIQKLVRKYKTNDPFLLCQYLNINVWFDDLAEGVRGYYFRTLRRRYIAINNNQSYEWQRFVCGHELGHDRMHKDMNRFFIENHTLFNPGRYEREANEFAVKLMVFGEEREEDETDEVYCSRNGVPREMVRYL